jgi:hypothetical protein
MEYVYKLNLPDIKSILLESKIDEAFNSSASSTTFKAKEFLKPEWLTFRNYNWEALVLFYKRSGDTTNIHSDSDVYVSHRPSWNTWCINWIATGWGTMDYWNAEDVSTVAVNSSEISHIPPYYKEVNPPVKSYTLQPGAYLTNVQKLHKGTGYEERFNFSLRCFTPTSATWADVVEDFQDLIIPW